LAGLKKNVMTGREIILRLMLDKENNGGTRKNRIGI
jgi:hypothetical protein